MLDRLSNSLEEFCFADDFGDKRQLFLELYDSFVKGVNVIFWT